MKIKNLILSALLLTGISASAGDLDGLVGGAIGGVIGNQFGGGNGKIAATIGGAVLGTMIGSGERTSVYRDPSYNRTIYSSTASYSNVPTYSRNYDNRYNRGVYIEQPVQRTNYVKTYMQRVDDFGNVYYVEIQQ